MTNILIVGIGGVGGYFGGLLSHTFEKSNRATIHFMGRGQNLSAIQSRGIHIKSLQGEFTTFPTKVSDDPRAFGQVDYIILCTKSYDIEETIQQLRPTVSKNTVFLPLLNGVDSSARIQSIFPDNLVAEGCANIISRLTAPGVIEIFSTFQTIRFGVQGSVPPQLKVLGDLFEEAGIDVHLTDRIWSAIWEKFIFISSAATATSYHNKTFGQIKENTAYRADLEKLTDEICLLAQAKLIDVPEDIKERVLQLFDNAPPESTTSMHADFLRQKGKTEVESLTGYVVKEGERYGLDLPTYRKMYIYLSNPNLAHTYAGYRKA